MLGVGSEATAVVAAEGPGQVKRSCFLGSTGGVRAIGDLVLDAESAGALLVVRALEGLVVLAVAVACLCNKE